MLIMLIESRQEAGAKLLAAAASSWLSPPALSPIRHHLKPARPQLPLTPHPISIHFLRVTMRNNRCFYTQYTKV
jgi:hypothetical protein